jgi:hypothetical protein
MTFIHGPSTCTTTYVVIIIITVLLPYTNITKNGQNQREQVNTSTKAFATSTIDN